MVSIGLLGIVVIGVLLVLAVYWLVRGRGGE